ncbi:hypothetical protein CG017_05919 (plasmid) [Burkholderia glumae]|nr:hypothetical protein KS03_5741 [Burkholderia glumae LMG 2196 = ATCC 33617]QKM57839.1 hypothetical protein CG017_05919 [Burkholderia glumae]
MEARRVETRAARLDAQRDSPVRREAQETPKEDMAAARRVKEPQGVIGETLRETGTLER